MVAKLLNAKDVSVWLSKQELLYASANAVGGVRIHLEFMLYDQHWVVRAASNVLYDGVDLEEAVKIYNENAY